MLFRRLIPIGVVMAAFCPATSYGGAVGRSVRIACAPSNSKVVAAVVEDAVWITLDDGLRWRRVAHWNDLRQPEVSMENEMMPAIDGLVRSDMETSPDDGESEDIEDAEEGFGDDATETAADSWSVSDELDLDPDSGVVYTFDNVRLAVGDSGELAVWHDGALVRLNPQGERWTSQWQWTPVDMLFDSGGNLWIASKNQVRSVSAEGHVRDRSIPHVRALYERQGGWIEAIGAYESALLSVEIDKPAQGAPTSRPSGLFEVIDAHGQGGVVAFLTPGEVVVQPGEKESKLVVSSRNRSVQIVASSRGQFFVRDSENRWWGFAGAHWRALEVFDVAVDAKGRVWFSSMAGPYREASMETDDQSPVQMTRMKRPETVDLARALFDEIGNPKCGSLAALLLPDISLNLAMSRMDRTENSLSEESMQTSSTTDRFVGIRLSWGFTPPQFMSCEAQRQRAYALLNDRRTKLRELERRLGRIRLELASCDGDLICALLRVDEEELETRIHSLMRF